MDFWIPMSCAETLSRLSILNYSQDYLIHMKWIACPLFKMGNSGTFKWGQSEAEAWTELKFLASLQIKNYTFNPEYIQLIKTDSSKVYCGYSHFQVDPEGKLQLVSTNGKQLYYLTK